MHTMGSQCEDDAGWPTGQDDRGCEEDLAVQWWAALVDPSPGITEAEDYNQGDQRRRKQQERGDKPDRLQVGVRTAFGGDLADAVDSASSLLMDDHAQDQQAAPFESLRCDRVRRAVLTTAATAAISTSAMNVSTGRGRDHSDQWRGFNLAAILA